MCAIGWSRVECVVQGKKKGERDKNKKIDGEEKTKNNDKSGKKIGSKKKPKSFSQWCSRESTDDTDQEGSEGRPLDHKYLRKGFI